MPPPVRNSIIVPSGIDSRVIQLIDIAVINSLVSGLHLDEPMNNSVAYVRQDKVTEINGKPVIDGSSALVLKNPVNGVIRKVFITGSRGSVYSAVLSFARDQWLPLPVVEYSLVDGLLPAVPAAFVNGGRTVALSTD